MEEEKKGKKYTENGIRKKERRREQQKVEYTNRKARLHPQKALRDPFETTSRAEGAKKEEKERKKNP